MILGHKEIETKQVFGSYKKYSYRSHSVNCPEGVECFVYCTSDYGFQKLLERWSQQASSHFYKSMGYFYTLTLKGYEGQPISLNDIIPDNKFKVKALLTDSYANVTYIQ